MKARRGVESMAKCLTRVVKDLAQIDGRRKEKKVFSLSEGCRIYMRVCMANAPRVTMNTYTPLY